MGPPQGDTGETAPDRLGQRGPLANAHTPVGMPSPRKDLAETGTGGVPSPEDEPGIVRLGLRIGGVVARWLWLWTRRGNSWLFNLPDESRLRQTDGILAAALGWLALSAGMAHYVFRVLDTPKLSTSVRWHKGVLAVVAALVVLFLIRRFRGFFMRLLINLSVVFLLVGNSAFIFELFTKLKGAEALTKAGIALAVNLVVAGNAWLVCRALDTVPFREERTTDRSGTHDSVEPEVPGGA